MLGKALLLAAVVLIVSSAIALGFGKKVPIKPARVHFSATVIAPAPKLGAFFIFRLM